MRLAPSSNTCMVPPMKLSTAHVTSVANRYCLRRATSCPRTEGRLTATRAFISRAPLNQMLRATPIGLFDEYLAHYAAKGSEFRRHHYHQQPIGHRQQHSAASERRDVVELVRTEAPHDDRTQVREHLSA